MLEVRDDVRSDVVFRIVDLVADLFLQRVSRDHAAGTFDLGDDQGAVLGDLRDGEAQMRGIGNVLLARLHVVSAGRLAAAFQQVAHGGAFAQLIPVFHVPAEFEDGGSHEDGGVRYAAGDDHVGACLQGLDDAFDAQIGVGGNDFSVQFSERLVILPDFDFVVLVDDGQDVVAGDAGDLHAGQAVLLCDLDALFGSGFGVGGAHVRDELDLMLPAQGQGLFHAVFQQAVVTLLRVLQLGFLADGDGALREAFVADIVEVSLFDEFQGGFQSVARIAGAGTDTNRSHICLFPFVSYRITR